MPHTLAGMLPCHAAAGGQHCRSPVAHHMRGNAAQDESTIAAALWAAHSRDRSRGGSPDVEAGCSFRTGPAQTAGAALACRGPRCRCAVAALHCTVAGPAGPNRCSRIDRLIAAVCHALRQRKGPTRCEAAAAA
eukprot:364313-Chlamydomonas_euryale.AAC.4